MEDCIVESWFDDSWFADSWCDESLIESVAIEEFIVFDKTDIGLRELTPFNSLS